MHGELAWLKRCALWLLMATVGVHALGLLGWLSGQAVEILWGGLAAAALIIFALLLVLRSSGALRRAGTTAAAAGAIGIWMWFHATRHIGIPPAWIEALDPWAPTGLVATSVMGLCILGVASVRADGA